MIIESNGDLLSADAEALVNTVNTVGVMGKGIALQFKRAYPQMFRDYERACQAGEVQRGAMHVWETGLLDGPRWIINFPTKGHWRSPSRMEDIESGLEDLVRVIAEKRIASIAVPPLGSGNGGLNWNEVRPRIEQALAPLEGVDILLYPPNGAPPARRMRTATARPELTLTNSVLVTLVTDYSRTALTASVLEVQKLLYFVQETGLDLRLEYQAHRYGPYADALRHVLVDVEGHYLLGFGDGSARVADGASLESLPGVVGEARAKVKASDAADAALGRVLALVRGWESMYGLELLSTVHWCATRGDAQDSELLDHVLRRVREWSPRKERMFTPRHVELALEHLRRQGWLGRVGAAVTS